MFRGLAFFEDLSSGEFAAGQSKLKLPLMTYRRYHVHPPAANLFNPRRTMSFCRVKLSTLFSLTEYHKDTELRQRLCLVVCTEAFTSRPSANGSIPGRLFHRPPQLVKFRLCKKPTDRSSLIGESLACYRQHQTAQSRCICHKFCFLKSTLYSAPFLHLPIMYPSESSLALSTPTSLQRQMPWPEKSHCHRVSVEWSPKDAVSKGLLLALW